MSPLRKLSLVALWVTLPLDLVAQVPDDAAQRVDAVFAPWSAMNAPGCAIGVMRNGLTVLERAYGMADLEHGISNTPATIFEGGSLAKQFTSAAIMLLVLDGELSLDDDVRSYIPELPDYGTPITLRHMMTHTSGLRDWGSVAAISGWGREQRSHDHDDVLDIMSRQSALNFEPGHEYSYSNTGFNLLAIVVSRVSGESFATFSKRRIFEPLGMRSTQWRDDYRRLVHGRSTAYSALNGGGWEINRPIEDVHGNGGILTTVGDLGIWNEALASGRLGGAAFLELMHRQGRLNDGSEIVYAAGLNIRDFAGVPSVAHTGSTAGYRAFLARYPEQRLSVAMLCNASNVSSGGIGGRVARIFLGDEASDPEPPVGVPATVADLRAFAGLYRDPVTGNTRLIRMEGAQLRDGGTVLVPMSDREFAAGAGGRRYVFESAGREGGFRIEDWQYTNQRYEPVEPWTPAVGDLEAYVGTYHSSDAETTYVIGVDGDRLTVWQRPNDTRALQPVYRDAFRSRGSMIRFRRDGTGRVVGLSLSLSRVYDMRFERIEA